ncbi:uncharacterized protein LOC143426394 [Xylocopa sonorina]|uniref:uncharacterized protein LOC143426394 n=1 Tax=Xylocopa sonorina TaxID=1818115 RepID=UPI00403A935F
MQVNLQKRENIQTTILALLLTHKGGCTLKQLVSDYYDLEGEHIPWRDLGYASLLSFLSSMSKTVQVEKENNTIIVKGIASEKSKHVSKLVGNQKCQKPPVKRKSYKPSHYFPKTAPPRVLIPAEILRKIIDLVNEHPDGVNKYYVLQEIQACMSFVNISMEEMEEQLRELSHQIFQSNNKIYPIHSDKAKYSDCLKKDNNMYSESKLTTQNEEKCDSVIVTVAGNESTDNILDYDEEDIFDFVPSTCTGYLNQTKSVTKIKPTANFIQETVSKCQDQVAEHTLLNCSYKDSTWNQIEHNTNVKKDKEDGEILINERVKFRLEKLIQNQPDGLWCAELPEKYLEEYKVPLNYTELGFNSVREFTSQLPEIFHCIQFCDSGDFKLYYAKREKPSNKTKQTYKTNNLMELHHIYEASNEEPLPAEVSLNTCKILIPDDVLTIGENVGYINVAHLAQNVEPFVEVVVVEVFTPSFFWIQLRKSKKIFKSFMDDLNNFYSTKCEQYVIPLVTLEKGLHCACMYNGVWHRGVIKTVKPDFQITIMFYDYGTLKTYPPEAVYYLHRMFSNLPAQAIPCGLINVRPRKGSKWSRSATLKFAMRTSEIPLIATIASINTEDNSMMVSLTDTLEEEDIHINDWLVEQKLAVHGKMVDKVDMSNILIYIEENLIFKPERCYEIKTNKFNNSNNTNNKSSKKVPNVPLISPQSTLIGMNNFKCLPQSTLFNEQKVPQIRENIQNQIFQNDSTPTVCTSSRNSTNPFLQDMPIYNEVNDSISPGKFMQLWNENLKIQMEITVTLSRLLNKVMKESEKNVKDDSLHNQDTLNMIRDALASVKRMPVFVDSTSVNIENPCKSTVSSIGNSGKNTAINNDFMNVEYSAEKSTCTARNRQSLSTPFCDRNHNLNTCIASTQTNITPIVTKTSNLANSTFLMPTNNDFDNLTQFLTNREPAKQCVCPESESCSNKLKLDSQNYFVNNTNIDLSKTVENAENNMMPLKETNPFRLSLAGKLHIPDANEANCLHSDNSLPSIYKNPESVVNYDLINFDNNSPKMYCANRSILNDFNNISLSNHENFVHDSSNKTSDERRNSSLNCNWNVGDIADKMANVINDQSTQHSENLSSPSNYDTYNCKSTSLLSVNDLECSASVNAENSNEECSTSLSTFHTLYSSSPIMEPSTNVFEEAQSKPFINDAQSKSWSNIYYALNNKNDSRDEQLNGAQNSTVKDLLNFEVNIDDTRTKDPYLKDNELRSVEESLCIKNHQPLTTKLFFQVIELPKQMIHIFHYQDEGWLLVNEFLEVFTTFETTLHLLSMLRALNIRVQFEEIDKSKNSIEFIQTNVNHNTVLLKAAYDIINGATKLHLMPLKSAVKLLHKLESISQEDLSDLIKFKKCMNDWTLHEIWLITSAYKQLRYLIKSEQ